MLNSCWQILLFMLECSWLLSSVMFLFNVADHWITDVIAQHINFELFRICLGQFNGGENSLSSRTN